jgi:hypothetical protein
MPMRARNDAGDRLGLADAQSKRWPRTIAG